MIRQIAYYIKPKTTLLEALANFPTFVELHVAPVIWIGSRGGYGELTPAEDELLVKLLFLAQFASYTYRGNVANRDQITGIVFGSQEIVEPVFDRWWTLERINTIVEQRQVIKHIAHKALVKIPATGIQPVDARIEEIRNRQRGTQP